MVNGEGDRLAGLSCHGPAVEKWAENTEKHGTRLEPQAAQDGSQDSSQVGLTPEVRSAKQLGAGVPLGDSGYSGPKFC